LGKQTIKKSKFKNQKKKSNLPLAKKQFAIPHQYEGEIMRIFEKY